MQGLKYVCIFLLASWAVGCGENGVAPLQSPSAPTTVGPSPTTVATAARTALQGISLVASPRVVASGDQLTLKWAAPEGRGCAGGGDWVALYKVGDPDHTGAKNGHSDLWFVHLCGETSGSSTLSAPFEPGEYEFRYMAGDDAAARSNPVTVNASTAPRPSVPTLNIDGSTASTRKLGETFWVVGGGYTPGQSVARYIDPPVNRSNIIVPLTADQFGNISWAFTPTCATFNPRNVVTVYAVDAATGQASNTITETVLGSCP